uniref:Cyclin-dependent kinase inhibitor n=1 Tax=Musa acuminata subsp. malaccensis TaxID=214687 RepID=A0A804L035_MUSAM|nr:PREDICTED: cyclin-dependent kinase inhibitor 1-like [Musa acuminata subsp. malaccensis]
MGKYTRKCSRGVGELAVMEVTQVVGVRTRGRSHSLADAAAPAVKSPRRRRTGAPPSTEVVQTSSYLQLRSRPLFMTIRRPRLQAENSPAASDPGPAAEGISQCSSNGSSEVVGDGTKVEVLGSSTCNFKSRRARETTPSSVVRREAGDLESTAARARMRSGSSPTVGATTTEAEIEEFFAAAETDQAQRFAEKYNYDVIGDVPLDGRFDWVRINL